MAGKDTIDVLIFAHGGSLLSISFPNTLDRDHKGLLSPSLASQHMGALGSGDAYLVFRPSRGAQRPREEGGNQFKPRRQLLSTQSLPSISS